MAGNVHGGALTTVQARYFRNVGDAIISTSCVLVLAYILWHFFQWAVVDGVWNAKSAAECQAKGTGACWAVLPARWRLILFGVYPFEEQWRAALGCVILLAAAVASCWPRSWRFWVLTAIWPTSFLLFLLLMRGGILGLSPISTENWGGLALSFFIFASAIVIGMPVATLLALARQSGRPWLRNIVGTLIDLTRSLPLIAILFSASLVVPLLLPGWLSGDKLFRVILGFAVFFAAYQAEVVRGGLQAVEKGQVEAAQALGMRYWQYQFTIVLPQAFRITLPQTVNQAVAGFKDTSYVAIVGFFDLSASASAALGTGDWALAFLEVYLFVGGLYFVFAYSLARYGSYLEGRMGAGRAR